MDGITDSRDMSWSKLQEMVKDREAWRAAVRGVTKSWTRLTEQHSEEIAQRALEVVQRGRSSTLGVEAPRSGLQVAPQAQPSRAVPELWSRNGPCVEQHACLSYVSPSKPDLCSSKLAGVAIFSKNNPVELQIHDGYLLSISISHAIFGTDLY